MSPRRQSAIPIVIEHRYAEDGDQGAVVEAIRLILSWPSNHSLAQKPENGANYEREVTENNGTPTRRIAGGGGDALGARVEHRERGLDTDPIQGRCSFEAAYEAAQITGDGDTADGRHASAEPKAEASHEGKRAAQARRLSEEQ